MSLAVAIAIRRGQEVVCVVSVADESEAMTQAIRRAQFGEALRTAVDLDRAAARRKQRNQGQTGAVDGFDSAQIETPHALQITRNA